MENQFSRMKMMIGDEGLEKIKNSHIAIFGIGGVGSFAASAIARSGVGKISIIDSDKVNVTNINRQLVASHSTIGKLKVDVMRDMINDINPDAKVFSHAVFYDESTIDDFDLTKFSYIIDAIDTVSSKLLLIENAYRQKIPIISAMGAGNKMCAEAFCVGDIYTTSVCPLAKVIRKELRQRGIESLKVVYSTEAPAKTNQRTPASMPFVPPVEGLILAGEVIKDILKD